MTYSLKVTPFAAAMLDGYCRAAGSSLKTTLGHHITQQTPSVADHAAATLAAASAEQPMGALPSHSQAAPDPVAPTETQPEDPAVEEEMLAYFDR